MPKMLTTEQVEQYHRDGFVSPVKIISEQETAIFHDHIEKIEMAGGTFPLAWTRSYGSGKVFVTLLGHDGRSQGNKGFQEVVLNGVSWVTS